MSQDRYPTHMSAALAEGLCPDCSGSRPVTVQQVEIADADDERRTVPVLGCDGCRATWWPAWIVRPDFEGWTILDGEAIRLILSVRTWSGEWHTPK
ncbi:hypothetical protein [Actinomadura hibisca]|uniref:hypothetical protein n=1 Tax=Actinomadura hibisca TaxID=68565 RepID=UPI000835A7D4|nr:hypothetical protein [Actinomadura hibisca]